MYQVMMGSKPYAHNVRDFGAVGDGVTDDTTAFEAAIAAMPVAGGVLHVPEGTYVVQLTTDKDRLTVAGIGQASVLRSPDGAASSSRTLILAGNDCTLRDITVNGSVELNNSWNSIVHDCTINAAGFDYGLRLERPVFNHVTSCRISSALLACIHSNQNPSSGLRVTDCKISDSGQDGLLVTLGHTTPSETKVSHSFLNNHFLSNDRYGLSIDGVHDNLIVGNIFERNGPAGIRLSRIVETNVTGNYFEYNSRGIWAVLDDVTTTATSLASLNITGNMFQGEATGVDITGTVSTESLVKVSANSFVNEDTGVRATSYRAPYILQITDNTFACITTSPHRAVRLEAGSSTPGSNIQVHGNMISESSVGITLKNLTDMQVDGNHIVNASMAAVETDASAVAIRGNRLVANAATVTALNGGTYSATWNVGLADS